MTLASTEPDPWEETSGFGSSNIAAFRFDKSTDTLQVDFTDGSTYELYNVSPATHRAFQASPSKGAFYARALRGKYSYEKL